MKQSPVQLQALFTGNAKKKEASFVERDYGNPLERPNQLYRELLSVSGLDPYVGYATSPRKQMFASHVGTHVTVSGASPRRQQTGMERQFGKFTFNKKTPVDLEVIRVIKRYPEGVGIGRINQNPQTIIIYENVETKELGVIDLRDFCSNHPYFGFVYRKKEALSRLGPRSFIKGGTVLLESPAVDDQDNYSYGVNSNMIHMSHEATSEDGIVFRKGWLDKFKYNTFEKIPAEIGPARFPINAFGTNEVYKICPDIGERVGDDGIVMITRAYNEDTAVFDQSPHALRRFYPDSDRAVVAPPGGIIKDIVVYHDPLSRQARVPDGMDAQLRKYSQASQAFYKEIADLWRRYYAERKEYLRVTPELDQLVVTALAFTDKSDSNRITFSHRRAKLDDWRIEFIIQYENTPNIGNKFTGCHGDKGVAVEIWDDHRMPVDEFGNVADIITDPYSTVGRSILGRVYEPKFNAVGHDIVQALKNDLHIDGAVTPQLLAKLDTNNGGRVTFAFNELLDFFKIISPLRMYPLYAQSTQQDIYDYMATVVNDAVILYLPPESEVKYKSVVMQVNERFGNRKSPVTFIGNSGVLVKTKESFLISSVYVMLLDKTGTDWAAVSVGKLQHYGVLGQLTSVDKYTSQVRLQGSRSHGESEYRIYLTNTKTYFAAETADRNNNKQVMEHMARGIMDSSVPGKIDNLVDRQLIPYGNHRVLQIIRNLGECMGARQHFKPYTVNNTVATGQETNWNVD